MLNIRTVTVLEDRAQVERVGSLVCSGLTSFSLDGFSPLAVDRSLKVSVRGGQLVDAQLKRQWKEKPLGGLADDATVLETKLQNLNEQCERQGQLLRRLDHRASLLETARTDLLRAIGEQAGNNAVDHARWSSAFELITNQQQALDDQRAQDQHAMNEIQKQLKDAQRAQSLAGRREQTFECLLQLSIEANGPVEVTVSYLVPCAVWRPAYRARLAGSRIHIEAEAYVWQFTGEAWSDVELRCSTARPTLGSSPPSMSDDVLVTRPKAEQEKKNIEVEVREEVIQNTGAGVSSDVPGIDDGGETRVLAVANRVSVKDDGQPHRFPLFHFETESKTELVAAPEYSSSVFCISQFANSANGVLFAGPVELLRESGFVGRGQLKFAAVGERVRLSFGREDGLQVVRHLDEKHDESRLTGRKTRLKKLNYFLSNQNAESKSVIIEERVAVSELKEVEVTVHAKESTPTPEVSAEGIARLALKLPADSTSQAQFVWELSAASTVRGL
jgi:uncharacterized protein (TIGR02231 family)